MKRLSRWYCIESSHGTDFDEASKNDFLRKSVIEEMVHAIRTDLRKEGGRYGVNTKGIFSYAAEDDISEGDSHTSVLAIGLDNVNAEISQSMEHYIDFY